MILFYFYKIRHLLDQISIYFFFTYISFFIYNTHRFSLKIHLFKMIKIAPTTIFDSIFFGQQLMSYFGQFSVFYVQVYNSYAYICFKNSWTFFSYIKFENLKFVFDWLLRVCKYLFGIHFHIKILLMINDFFIYVRIFLTIFF